MHNLKQIHLKLIDAVANDCFLEAVLSSPLSILPLHRHPLGFAVARIVDDHGFGLRLHFWNGEVSTEQAPFAIHDHRFDLDSLVVRGTVEQETFVAIEDPIGAFQRYAVSYSGAGSRLDVMPGRVRLETRKLESFQQGQRNILDAGVLHRLRALTDNAITLVATTDRLSSPIALGPADGPISIVADRGLASGSGDDGLTVVADFIRKLVVI